MQVDGRRLRALREAQGRFQRDVAQAASISKSYLSMLEGGERRTVSPAVAARLAGALGTSMADLRPRAPRLLRPRG